jgi:ATP phosphoribosyltransferase regulatory subunit
MVCSNPVWGSPVPDIDRPLGSDVAALAARVTAVLASAHFKPIEPDILQPASVFLDLSGEDIRSRLYLTSDASGTELCLRPEYTIPVCRAYLASGRAGSAAAFSYVGPVFRYRPGESGEFRQAGIESFGRADREAADAEILAVALQAVETAGGTRLQVTMGDAGLFARLLDVIDVSPLWRRRLKRGFAAGKTLASVVALDGAPAQADHSGVLSALEKVDKKGARALVQDLLSIAGISSVGGRTAGEIAERFLEQASIKSGAGFAPHQRDIMEQFLAVSGDPDHCSAVLRKLTRAANLDLDEALDCYDARINFLAARGIDVKQLHFATAFGRNLDYYTGFVFEARDPSRPTAGVIIGGGRYDQLLRTLGATHDVPAVGAAIWISRIESHGA